MDVLVFKLKGWDWPGFDVWSSAPVPDSVQDLVVDVKEHPDPEEKFVDLLVQMLPVVSVQVFLHVVFVVSNPSVHVSVWVASRVCSINVYSFYFLFWDGGEIAFAKHRPPAQPIPFPMKIASMKNGHLVSLILTTWVGVVDLNLTAVSG